MMGVGCSRQGRSSRNGAGWTISNRLESLYPHLLPKKKFESHQQSMGIWLEPLESNQVHKKGWLSGCAQLWLGRNVSYRHTHLALLSPYPRNCRGRAWYRGCSFVARQYMHGIAYIYVCVCVRLLTFFVVFECLACTISIALLLVKTSKMSRKFLRHHSKIKL
jgi:hypothetical protein